MANRTWVQRRETQEDIVNREGGMRWGMLQGLPAYNSREIYIFPSHESAMAASRRLAGAPEVSINTLYGDHSNYPFYVATKSRDTQRNKDRGPRRKASRR